jgi:starvation-inducible DNA-binding protein
MSQSDDNQILYAVRIDIPPEIRLYVMQLLQQTLACTVDLRSQIKQACWNVKGHDVVLLHALFATMATELDAYTDLVAERLVVLGGVAWGTARTAATPSTLPAYPGAIMDGDAHVRALAERFAPYATALRADITHATEVEDAGSAAIYTDISRGVDTRLWGGVLDVEIDRD